jgi:uncharacterized cupin superfamily protein
MLALGSIIVAGCANSGSPGTTAMKETFPVKEIIPIAIEKSFLDGMGLVADDPTEYTDYTKSEDGGEREAVSRSSSHVFHHDKIHVSVIEAGPGKVRVDGLPYDEFVHILQGRLILTLDDGHEFKFQQGESFIVPKGFVGIWEMPERYRELVVVDTEALPAP